MEGEDTPPPSPPEYIVMQGAIHVYKGTQLITLFKSLKLLSLTTMKEQIFSSRQIMILETTLVMIDPT